MDSMDLDPQPKLGMGFGIYWILNRFRMDLGESEYFEKLSVIFLPSPVGSGDQYVQANQAHKS